MSDYKELIKLCDPLIIEDGMGFRLVHELDEYDEVNAKDTGQTTTFLSDSEGDGSIKAEYNAKYYGVDITLKDLSDNVVCATFKKSELKQFLKLLTASLELLEETGKKR